jgi:hypothetical protein
VQEATPASTPPPNKVVHRKKDPQKVAAGRKGAAARAAKARERVLAELDAEKLKIYEEAAIKRAQESSSAGENPPSSSADPSPSLSAPQVRGRENGNAGNSLVPPVSSIAILACCVAAGIAVLALRRTAPGLLAPAPAPVPKTSAPVPVKQVSPIHVKQRDPFDM